MENICNGCGKTVPKKKNCFGLYCSNKCQMQHQTKILIEKWKRGEISGYTGKTKALCKWLRKYLFDTRGSACSKCGWDDRHPIDNSILTEINHIDGNAENNKEENLEILCPNCHAKTVNFRARNKSSKRNRIPR